MALIAWSAGLSVGVPDMDSQHQKLIAMVNELHEAMTRRQGRTVLSGLLNRLVAYTASHFNAEEQFMQGVGFPGYTEHKRLHDELTAQVMALKKRVETGETAVTLEVMSFLEKWLKNHILGVDGQYGRFAKTRASAVAG